jgi:methylisocitrate lyase
MTTPNSFNSHRLLALAYKQGVQENVLDIMQTRDELYDRLDYLNFEKNLDEYIKNMEDH